MIIIKEVAILTFHHTTNYGAVLQTYALQTVIEKLGNKCTVVDYRCPLVESNFNKLHFYNFRNPFNYIKYRLNINYYLEKFDNFNDFIDQNIKLTKTTYYNKKELLDLDFMFDKFVCGSDQIWNYKITDNDTTFFLDFIQNSDKKISYAASFGLQQIEDKYIDIYKRNLSTIKYISVRESSGKDIIKKLIDKEVNVVLDPTLLLKKEDWMKLNTANILNNDFILVYELEKSDEMIEYAVKLAHEYGCKVIVISSNRVNPINKDLISFQVNCSPKEFISYMVASRYVITNSFHGTAFSINLNINFTTFLLTKSSHVNSRLINLLEIFDLTYRIYKTNFTTLPTIDYNVVNEKLYQKRKSSINFLKLSIDDNMQKEK